MGIRTRLATATCASMLALSSISGFAADSTPAASPSASPAASQDVKAYIGGMENTIVGYAEVKPAEEGVWVQLYAKSEAPSTLKPGDYEVSLSQYGYCDASVGFASAGDLSKIGSVTVWDDGTYDVLLAAKENSLDPNGTGSLTTPNGSAVVLSQDGKPMACGIVSRIQDVSKLPAASPVASPAATPKS